MTHRFLLALGAVAILSCGSTEDRSPAGRSRGGGTVTLSNLSLPQDTAGSDLVTGEASVLAWGGAYYNQGQYAAYQSRTSRVIPVVVRGTCAIETFRT